MKRGAAEKVEGGGARGGWWGRGVPGTHGGVCKDSEESRWSSHRQALHPSAWLVAGRHVIVAVLSPDLSQLT